MKLNKNYVICYLVLLLVITHIFLSVEIFLLRSELKSFKINLTAAEEKFDLQINEISGTISVLSDRQEESSADIKNDLASVKKRTDAQFSKTLGMSRTYDSILEEQKKKTVDTAEKDREIIKVKEKAFSLYKKRNFAEAYEEYKKLILSYSEDTDSRTYKVKSLYYKNKADSSAYQEILSDIKYLKQNDAADAEILEIERAVLAEKEGVND
mgnify:CR=1 FL=1